MVVLLAWGLRPVREVLPLFHQEEIQMLEEEVVAEVAFMGIQLWLLSFLVRVVAVVVTPTRQ